MDTRDKALLLDMLNLPRFGLSPSQIMGIERIIDGAPQGVPKAPRPWVPYPEAAALLGIKTRQGVAYRIKQGALEAYKPDGMDHALGVTRASLERALGMEIAS